MILQSADQFAVPAGQALAVDRDLFSQWITQQIEAHPSIQIVHQEASDLDSLLSHYDAVLIATGPLTSSALATSLQIKLGSDYLAFYDAIAPVIMTESIDFDRVFKASRYDKGEADYVNCPMDHAQYEAFIDAILQAEKVAQHDFENIRPFEGCLPIEVMAERGRETLRFGPMKPVGLWNPHTQQRPHAVVQLRQENHLATLYNMVGFQTKMTWTAQKEIFKTIPGLENAEFARLGSIHRNTFVNSPEKLTSQLQLKDDLKVFFAGQITGVEGYIESTASGILASQHINDFLQEKPQRIFPQATMMGALVRYVTESDPKSFQPMNANFGLLDPPSERVHTSQRKAYYVERSLKAIEEWIAS